MCIVKCSTSGRETSWSWCPESFCPPKLARTCPPPPSGRLGVQPQPRAREPGCAHRCPSLPHRLHSCSLGSVLLGPEARPWQFSGTPDSRTVGT